MRIIKTAVVFQSTLVVLMGFVLLVVAGAHFVGGLSFSVVLPLLLVFGYFRYFLPEFVRVYWGRWPRDN